MHQEAEQAERDAAQTEWNRHLAGLFKLDATRR